MSDSLEFRLLRYIIAVAETGNFTRAAKRLYLAQPSLSAQIRNLEAEIKFPIFQRTNRGVRVTPAGEMVVAYARELLRSRDELLSMALAVYLGKFPTLRVGFSAFVNAALLQRFHDDYCAMFPHCEMQLVSGEPAQILERIAKRELDCAVLLMPIDNDRFQVQQIAKSRLAICMRSDDVLASEEALDIRQVASRITIVPDAHAQAAAHKQLVELFEEVHIPFSVVGSASTPAEIQWMVKAGYGLALIDHLAPLDAGITTRSIADAGWKVDTAFVYRDRSDHLALPFLERFFDQQWRAGRAKRLPKSVKAEQLRLIA